MFAKIALEAKLQIKHNKYPKQLVKTVLGLHIQTVGDTFVSNVHPDVMVIIEQYIVKKLLYPIGTTKVYALAGVVVVMRAGGPLDVRQFGIIIFNYAHGLILSGVLLAII